MDNNDGEYLEDISGSDHLKLTWGDRYKGWYQTILPNYKELIDLEVKGLTYHLNVCEYQFRFIMPPRVEFFRGVGEGGHLDYGIIDYSQQERLLGVFRFPLDEKGFFSSPIKDAKIDKDLLMTLSTAELQDLVNKKKVLTFEAFKMPYFGFKYFHIKEKDFNEITILAGDSVSDSIRGTYEKELTNLMSNVKDKIESSPNILLILQNILDRKIVNEKEVSEMTGDIIHFGV